MRGIEFKPWPKTARLYREMVVTEKIDGTNSAIGIVPLDEMDRWLDEDGNLLTLFEPDQTNALAVVNGMVVYAQSRNRLITPGKATDNFGFASWVKANAEQLVLILGEGLHYGEWWGSKIARNYGLTNGERRFSLFRTDLQGAINYWQDEGVEVTGLGVVPTLYEGVFDQDRIDEVLEYLRDNGSMAEPGFMRPEGIVVYHTASRTGYKALLENDALPKTLAA